jgi:2-oxo-hept-3-ene-1,7-dioate hydratase
MLDENTIGALAQRLDDAERSKAQIRMFSQKYPVLGLDDAYAIQRAWTN